MSASTTVTVSKRQDKPRARDLGITPGVFAPGPLNGITDVDGVLVGNVGLAADGIQTGVTAIIPHGGNLYQEKVPAGFVVGNGYGQVCGFDTDSGARRDRDANHSYKYVVRR